MSRIISDGVLDSGEPLSAINVTSLVDVMFCLLIMFMVATPLMTPDIKQVDPPAGRGTKIEVTVESFNQRVVVIDKTGNAFLGVLPLHDAGNYDADTVVERLGKNPVLQDSDLVFLQADAAVDYGRVIDVLLALKQANVGKIGFVTDPDMKRLRGQTP